MNLTDQTATPLARQATFFGQTMAYLMLAIAASAGGIFGGFYLLPPELVMNTGFMLAMFAVTLILIFTSKRWSTSQFGYLFLIIFAGIFGLTMVPLIAYALAIGGALLVGKALLATVGLYTGLALYGLTTHRDLSGMGGFLMASLIGLIMVSLISLVLHFFGIQVWTSGVELWVSGFGVLLFAGFTVYDFQKVIRESDQISPIQAAIRLFLNFILLFQYILRLMLAGRD